MSGIEEAISRLIVILLILGGLLLFHLFMGFRIIRDAIDRLRERKP